MLSGMIFFLTQWIVPDLVRMPVRLLAGTACVTALLGLVTERLLGKNVPLYGRGEVSFLTSLAVFYLGQFIVADMAVSFSAAVVAALAVGTADTVMLAVLKNR